MHQEEHAPTPLSVTTQIVPVPLISPCAIISKAEQLLRREEHDEAKKEERLVGLVRVHE